MLLQQYSFVVEYCRGIDNKVADFFSRNPNKRFTEENPDRIIISALHQCFLPNLGSEDSALVSIALINDEKSLSRAFRTLSALQGEDEMIQSLVQRTKDKLKQTEIQKYENIWFIKEGPEMH